MAQFLKKICNGHEEGSVAASCMTGSNSIPYGRIYFITYKGICISLLHGKPPCFGANVTNIDSIMEYLVRRFLVY